MTTDRSSTLPGSRRIRAAVIALVVAGLAVSFAPSARADSASLVAGKTAWFWLSNQKVTTCADDPVIAACGGASGNGGVFGNAAGTTSPISPGHLGVAMKDGNPDMDAYIFFKTPKTMRGADVTRFIVTLTVARASNSSHVDFHSKNQAKPPATANEGTAAIQACLVTEPWGPAEGEPRYSTTVVRPHPESGDNKHQVTTVKNEPSSDCAASAEGVPSADGSTWTFDITDIAKRWAGGVNNDGIALLPVPSTVAPTWTVEFHGAPATAVAADGSPLTYVTPQEAARAELEFTPGSSSGGGFTPPPVFDPGSGGVTFPPTVDPGTGGFPPVDPGTGDPGVTPPQNGGGTVVPVAFMGKTPAWFWPVLLLGFAALWLMSRLIGDDPLAATMWISRSGNRVATVLRGRRLAGEHALPAAEAIAAEEAAGTDL